MARLVQVVQSGRDLENREHTRLKSAKKDGVLWTLKIR